MVVFFQYALITGLQMYAKYETCDPTSAGIIDKIDQVIFWIINLFLDYRMDIFFVFFFIQTLPYFVMQVGGAIPGLAGLFISGIFAAALSTISSSLNTLSGTIYEDFLKSRYGPF